MNSLEWINKKILLVKENKQFHEDLLFESEEYPVVEITSAIERLKLDLQTLQQIKTELEAWYVLKNSDRYVMFNRDIDTKKLSVKYTFITDSENKEVLDKALEVKK